MTQQPSDSLPRETGVEKLRTCPVCGGEMVETTSAYGSVTADCPNCTGAAQAPVQTASESLPRETGTQTEEPSDG